MLLLHAFLVIRFFAISYGENIHFVTQCSLQNSIEVQLAISSIKAILYLRNKISSFTSIHVCVFDGFNSNKDNSNVTKYRLEISHLLTSLGAEWHDTKLEQFPSFSNKNYKNETSVSWKNILCAAKVGSFLQSKKLNAYNSKVVFIGNNLFPSDPSKLIEIAENMKEKDDVFMCQGKAFGMHTFTEKTEKIRTPGLCMMDFFILTPLVGHHISSYANATSQIELFSADNLLILALSASASHINLIRGN